MATIVKIARSLFVARGINTSTTNVWEARRFGPNNQDRAHAIAKAIARSPQMKKVLDGRNPIVVQAPNPRKRVADIGRPDIVGLENVKLR